MKRIYYLSSIIGLGIMLLGAARLVQAVDDTWTETDWSASTAYSSVSNLDTATAGQVTLAATSQWYNLNWLYRKQLTLTNAQSQALTNFPVLVSLSSSNFDFTLAQSAGQDIRFTDADGTTVLSYEIEQWSTSASSAKIWVKVPQVDVGSSDRIYMYYGNSGASDGQAVTGTWNNNYQAVYHLNDTLSTTTLNDSTSHNNDGTSQGGMTTSNQVSGQVGGAVDFDGVDDFVSVADAVSLDITDDLTIEAWLKADTAGTVPGTISNTVLDTLEFDTSNGDTPSMVQVTSGLYAIAYRGSGNDGFVSTVTIDSAGLISNSVVDTLEFDTSDGFEPSLVQVSSTVYAVAYRGSSDDGFLATFTIDSSGNISNSVVDTLEFDTSNGEDPHLMSVTGSVYAVAYTGASSDGFLATVTIDSSGNISNSVVDTLEFDTSNGQTPSLVQVNSSVYAIAYEGPSADGFVTTVTIDSSGNISNSVVDTLEFDTSTGQDPSLIQVNSTVYLTAYTGPSGDGFAASFTIDSSGNISNSVLDTLEFDATDATEIAAVKVMHGVSAIAYHGPGDDGFMATVTIDSSGNISNSVLDTLEFDANTGKEPSFLPITDHLYAVAYHGIDDDGFMASVQIASAHGVFKGDAFGIDNTSSAITANSNDQFLTTTANTNWKHVVLTYNKDAASDQQKLYVNGALVTSQTYTSSLVANSNALHLGQYFDGKLDEVRLANTVQSADWIAVNYAAMAGSGVVAFGTQEQRYVSSGTLTSVIFDTGLTGVNWGSTTYTTSITAATSVKVRTGNTPTLSDATAFASCVSVDSCVTDGDRYAQYEVTLTASANQTPIWQDITVNYSHNSAPTADHQAVTTLEDTAKAITVTGSDIDGDTLTYTVVTSPTHGTLSTLNSSTGAVTYTPTANYNGSDSFTFTASDGNATASAATVTITVTSLNDGPVADAGANQIVTEDTGTVQLSASGSADLEGDTLSYAWSEATDSADGCSLTAFTTSATTVTLANKDSSYSCIFSLVVSDGQTTSSTDSVVVNIVADNDTPVVVTLVDQSGQEGTALQFNVTASDVDSSTLDLAVEDVSGNFSAQNLAVDTLFTDHGNNTGTFSWVPTTSQAGTYRVRLLASDTSTTTGTTINLVVANRNQAPYFFTALPNVAVFSGTSQTVFDLDDYVSDPDNDSITYTVSGATTVGISIAAGSVTVTAPDTFTGTETLQFTATDPAGLSHQSNTIVLNVTLPDPTAENFGYATGSSTGSGVIQIYDTTGRVLAEWQAFEKGGAIPRIMVQDGEYYIVAVKRRAGSTIHAYALNGELLDKQRLSPKLHWRKLAISDENIIVATRRSNRAHLRLWVFNLTERLFELQSSTVYQGIHSNQFRLTIDQRLVKILSRSGQVLYTWRPILEIY